MTGLHFLLHWHWPKVYYGIRWWSANRFLPYGHPWPYCGKCGRWLP